MNYSNWKKRERSPAGLFLDPRNPRIPPSPQPLSEPQLIEELVLHDDVYELARNIATNGFFPNESLVAIKERGKFVVVEGNRRLAACKLLLSPEISPERYKVRFMSLSSTFDQNLIKKLPVLIPPSREAALPLIIARHTATQIERWQPFMQARFYFNLIELGESVAEVAAKFGLNASDIREALYTHSLYQMACRLDLPDDVSLMVRDPRKFSLTTLTRIFETPDARRFFGVSLGDDGVVRGGIDQKEFCKGFSRVVTDIAKESVDSRSLNKPTDIMNYLGGFQKEDKPDVSKKGVFDSTTFQVGTPPKPSANAPKKQRKTKPKKPTTGLIPTSFVCNSSNARVKNLFDELTHLSPRKYPNACAFTFRCFWELSLFCFLDSKGEIAKMISEGKAAIAAKNAKLSPGKEKLKLAAHWTPGLALMLKRVADPNLSIISQPQITKALNKVIHDEQELFALNLFVHNSTYHPSEPKLRALWANLEEFFRVVLS